MKITLFILFIFFASLNVAQDSSSQYKYWVNAGMRLKAIDDVGIHLNYNFSLENVYAQMFFSAQKFSVNNRTMETYIGSIACGERIYKRYYLVAIFIGPSVVWGNRIAADKNSNFSTVGLNINLQLYFKPLSEIGLGIELIQNFNREKSFTEFHFSMSFNNNK